MPDAGGRDGLAGVGTLEATMIPPFLITKAAGLLAPVAAKFASPLVKWGTIAGAVVLLLAWTNWKTYDHMRTACEEERALMVAQQAEAAAKMAVQAHQMGAVSVQEVKQEERIIESKMADVRKEVVSHARNNPKPLSVATVALYDRLISVPNDTAVHQPAPDLGAGGAEVSRGGMGAEASLVLRNEEGEDIGLTTEDLAQAATDFAEKYALLKSRYKKLSDWNDDREHLEIERLMSH